MKFRTDFENAPPKRCCFRYIIRSTKRTATSLEHGVNQQVIGLGWRGRVMYMNGIHGGQSLNLSLSDGLISVRSKQSRRMTPAQTTLLTSAHTREKKNSRMRSPGSKLNLKGGTSVMPNSAGPYVS